MSQLARQRSNHGGVESRRAARIFSSFGAPVVLALSFACATCVAHSAGETSAHFLARHGIALTKEGLIAALSNSDLWIRLGAGQQLVLDGEKDAIPFIRAAAAREPRLANRLTFAFDLAQLGDQSGADLLRAACSNASIPTDDRVSAATSLLYLHSDVCVSDVLSILESDIDPPEVIQALDFFSGFKYLLGSDGGDKKAEIVATLVRHLSDDDSGVRITASNVLSSFGNGSAAGALREAIARETDQGVKQAMQRDLETLEKKTQ